MCRLRDVPIITFVNKLDREARDPFDLLDEIEQTLALDVTPASWPIGMGRDFLGTYDLFADALLLFERGDARPRDRAGALLRARRPEAGATAAGGGAARGCATRSRWRAACAQTSTSKPIAQGHLTPVFFGSALNNFGVRELLGGIGDLAPPPRPQPAEPRADPARPSTKVTGFVFKVQANIDPQHRDRIAFLRLCSGRFRAA